MTKVLLACSAGMSTASLEKNMKDYIKKENLNYEVKALSAAGVKQLLATGEKWDVLLLGPQVGYMKNDFTEIIGDTVLDVIPAAIYAMVKGKETLELAIKLLANKK